MTTTTGRLKMTLDMIKFEHSIFALPFALTGAMLALRAQSFAVPEAGTKLIWILAAMIGARSAGMAFNRLVDASIDGRNPRTRARHIPAGLLSPRFVWIFFVGAAALFLLAAAQLNPLCLKLAPLALAILCLYSYTKRFTAWAHVVLGFALGIAPMAASIAITGAIDWRLLWLTAAVTFWTAGFDIIYSCQDFDFDRQAGLHSIPARMGIGPALQLARVLHILMLLCLGALWAEFELGRIALAGIAAVGGLLAYEHRLVRADDLSKVDAAFFTMNGWVSVLFFAFWGADIWWSVNR
jgi:4-hydroxybenzoate polyprenyltransferase